MDRDMYSETERALIRLAESSGATESLARETLVAVTNALLPMAFRDALTGLWNRRYFDVKFQSMLQEAESLAGYRGCAVLIIDLDGFKARNDTRGHSSGDTLLRETATALQTALYQHKNDVVARTGGDEFGILLRDLTMQGMESALRRIVETLFRSNVPASIGALYCPPQPNLEGRRIIHRADALMYKAKKAPREAHRFVIPMVDVYTPTEPGR